MEKRDRIIAYIDGSNFYHLCKSNYGLANISFEKVIKTLLKTNEEIIKIKYFNSPINQQEEPEKYIGQQKFFNKIKNEALIELHLGRLVKRPLNKITLNCEKCGIVEIENLECPKCSRKTPVEKVHKTSEKGPDVKMAIEILLDALNNKYDSAFILSGDADFCPAIKHIINVLNKRVILCRFPKPKTNELIQSCSETRIITKDFILNSKLA